jgi:hypothetical protein
VSQDVDSDVLRHKSLFKHGKCVDQRPGSDGLGPGPRSGAAQEPDETGNWMAGQVLLVGGQQYLLQGVPTEARPRDRGWIQRQATAERLPRGALVHLRQLVTQQDDPAGANRRQGLRDQGQLLRARRAGSLLPGLVNLVEDVTTTTLVTFRPHGRSWGETFGAEAFGVGPGMESRQAVAHLLGAAVEVANALAEVHRAGYAHRELGPDAIVIDRAGHGLLGDAGLIGMAPTEVDGRPLYRAPEQLRPPFSAGPATDLYQFAALIRHTLTGHPAGSWSPPVRASLPFFPSRLDDLLKRAVDLDARYRPQEAAELAAALRAGHRQLTR